MYRESSFWIIGIVPSIKNTESQFGEFRHWVWSPVLASMFEPISKCHFCKQSKRRRNFRCVLGGNKTGFRCNSCHSGQRARQDGDSGERSGKGARTTSISHKATDGGNQFYRICYAIASFIFVLLSFLGKVSHQWLPPPHLFFLLQCKGKMKPATTYPSWPLFSRCSTLHPPATKAENISVLLFPRQPCRNPYPWFPLSELHSANSGISLCNCFSLQHDCLNWENILLLIPKLGLQFVSG